MPAQRDFYLDGAKLSWQEFLNYLRNFKHVSEREDLFAHVRPPAGCAGEALRVIRDLGLDERVELIGAEPAGIELAGIEMAGIELAGIELAGTELPRIELAAQDSGAFSPAKVRVRLRTPLRRSSIWWGSGGPSQSSGKGGPISQDPAPDGAGGTASS
jgi:hypothetical protein